MSISLLGIGGALSIGFALGLLGSGGSIVTVPVLVYLFSEPEKQAIAGSLAVVGTVAAFGAFIHARKGAVVLRVTALFAPMSMLGAWLGASASQLVSGSVQLATFALAMLGAAVMMLRPPSQAIAASSTQVAPDAGRAGAGSYFRLLASGAGVGLLTGFVGVGGGFLIVPALVLGARLEMHRAVGTSLTIIALTAFAGFAKHSLLLGQDGQRLDYTVLLLVTALGIAGTVLGQRLGAHLPAATLRRGFGAVLVLLACFMLWQILRGAR